MKIWSYFLFLMLLQLTFTQIKGQQIRILSDFDRGSVGSLKQVSETKFKGQTMHWIKKDKLGNQYYWFYFRIEHVKNKTLSFEFSNLIGTYRNNPHEIYTEYTEPVVSYDNQNWERITNVKYNGENKTFTFTANFQKDTAWIAYAHPYSYSSGIDFLDNISRNEYVRLAGKGVSPEGRSINLIEITDSSSNIKKKKIFITALQHAIEDCGGYFMEGAINFLISDDPEAVKIRSNYVFYLIPMMNPDGLYQGCTRYNTDMEDLNSEWDDDISDTLNLPVEPEVRFVKDWIKSFYDGGNKMDLFIDVHSHGQMGKTNGLCVENEELSNLTDEVEKYWEVNTVTQNNFIGSAGWFFSKNLHVPSATLELTQSSCGQNKFLDVDDYRFYGLSFVKAIHQYFKKLGE